jgi:uncharacterized protein with NRDE domain
MCLIALAWRTHPRYRLILAANRDEFHARPTLPLAAWDDAPDIVGGRDALHGGSWLALRGRRLAAVTNVRRLPEQEGRSRGELVADFVRGDSDTAVALHTLASADAQYRLFNLLVYDGDTLAFATNRAERANIASEPSVAVRTLAPGIHGISNGALDAPWPKTETLMKRLDAWCASAANPSTDLVPDRVPDLESLFAALADTTIAADTRLPDTGIGLERERFLSPAFIAHELYGTRASTVVLIADDHAEIVERRFGPEVGLLGEARMRIAFAS